MSESEGSDLDCSDDEVTTVPCKRQRRSTHQTSTMSEGDTSSREGWSSQSNWIDFQKKFDDVSRTRPMILLYFDEGEEKMKSSSHFREDIKLKKMVDYFRYLLTGEIRPQEGMNHIEMEEVLQMLDVDPYKIKVEELRDLYKKLCNTIFKRTKSKNFWTEANKPEGWPLEHFQGPDNAGKGKNGHRLKQGELRKVIMWFQERYGPNGHYWKQQAKTASSVAGDMKIPSLPASYSLLSVESGLGSSMLSSTVFSPPGSTYTPGPKSVKTPGPPNTPLNKTPRSSSDVKSPKGGLHSVTRGSCKPHTPLPKTSTVSGESAAGKGMYSGKMLSVGEADAVSSVHSTVTVVKKIKKEPCVQGQETVSNNLTTRSQLNTANIFVNNPTDSGHAILPPGGEVSNTTLPMNSVYKLTTVAHVSSGQQPGAVSLATSTPASQPSNTAMSLPHHPTCSVAPTPVASTSNTALNISHQYSSNSPKPTSDPLLSRSADHFNSAPQPQTYFHSDEQSMQYRELLPVKKETISAPPNCVISADHSNEFQLSHSHTPNLHSAGYVAESDLLNSLSYFDLNTVDILDTSQAVGSSVSPAISPGLGVQSYPDELLQTNPAHHNMDWSDAMSVISDDSSYPGSYDQNRPPHIPLLNSEHDPLLSNHSFPFADHYPYGSSNPQSAGITSHRGGATMYRSPGKKGGKQQKRLQQAAQKRLQHSGTGTSGKRMRKSRGKH